MKVYLIASVTVLLALGSVSVQAAPHAPESAQQAEALPEQLQVTIHLVEDGNKKSSQTAFLNHGASAGNLSVRQNNHYTRNFITAERREGKNVLVRLHQCSGVATAEELANLSSINCRPEMMSRLNIDAKLNQATVVETSGPNGEKQEYLIFVDKAQDRERPETDVETSTETL